jgi:hypothetical protein
MKNILLTTILSLFTIQSFAQQGISYSGGTSTKMDYAFLSLKDDNDMGVRGSKYLSDNFVRAKISDFEDKVFAVRYDIFNDQMEFQGGNNQIYIMNKEERSRKITFLDSNDVYSIFDFKSDDGDTSSGYFTALSTDGDYQLLKKNKVIFIEEKVSATGYDAPKPAMYKKTKDRHYIIINGAPAVLVDTNKKRFVTLFKGQEKDALSFIKKNKIKLSNDTDLIKFVNFLNSK